MKIYLQTYVKTFLTIFFLIMLFAVFSEKPSNLETEEPSIFNLVVRNWWEIWAFTAMVAGLTSGLVAVIVKISIPIFHKHNASQRTGT